MSPLVPPLPHFIYCQHWRFPTINLFWPIYLAVFNAVDGVSTMLALKAGFAREANPIMRYLFDHVSSGTSLGIKIALGILSPFTLWCISRHSSVTPGQVKFIRGSLVFSCLMYTFVIGCQFALWHAYLNGAFDGR